MELTIQYSGRMSEGKSVCPLSAIDQPPQPNMDGPANLSELIPNTVIDTCIYPIGIALQHILLQKYISLGLIPSDTVYHNHFATYRIIFFFNNLAPERGRTSRQHQLISCCCKIVIDDCCCLYMAEHTIQSYHHSYTSGC